MLDLKKFDSLSICNLLDILETMLNTVDINIIGIIIFAIMFPIKVIANNSTGCITFAETILPVVIIKVIRIGVSMYINPTKSLIADVVIFIISTKFDIIIVTINMYCT